MTSLSFLPIPEDDDVLAEKITLLAGQLNSGDYCLLRIAEYGTASHLEKVVNKYRRVQRSDDEVHENEQDNARKLVYFQQEDGMWVIHATLPPEAGSLVVKAIEAVATPVQLEKQEQLKREKLEKQEKLETAKDVSAETFLDDVEKEEPYHFQDLLEHTWGRRGPGPFGKVARSRDCDTPCTTAQIEQEPD